MPNVRIVTDSACDLTDEEAQAASVEIVPLSIRFGEDEFTDRVGLTVDEFYARMATSDELPETAAPAPGAFAEVFRRLAADGADAIVCINISLELSATGQAAQSAADDVADEGITVHVVDSKSVTCGLGTMVLRAAAAAADGANADEIVTLVEGLRERTRVYGVIDTLENLKKGGRIGGAQALLGTMLSIKPLLDLSSGVVVEAGRQRTRKKALAWLRNKLAEDAPVESVALYAGDADDADDLLDAMSEIVPRDEIRTGDIGAVIGTHGGPHVVGMSYLVT